MLRRDYIIAAIEEFGAMLARITGLAGKAEWRGAEQTIEQQCQRLAGVTIDQLDGLSDTELLAAVMAHEPLLTVETKIMLLSAILKSSGDVLVARNQTEQGRARYFKGLHLLLNIDAPSPNRPDFIPTIDTFLAALEQNLPLETQLLLMRHYEQSGQFAKAEDRLFTLIDADPSAEVIQFGEAFYGRLLGHTDWGLEAGGLPRGEVEAGLRQLRERNASGQPPQGEERR